MLDNPKWKNLIEFIYVEIFLMSFNLKTLKLLNKSGKSCHYP